MWGKPGPWVLDEDREFSVQSLRATAKTDSNSSERRTAANVCQLLVPSFARTRRKETGAAMQSSYSGARWL